MATIRSSIEIQDRFSSALSKLDSGLGNAGKGFDSLKGKLGGNIMGGLSKGIDAVTSKTSSLGSAFKSMLGANVIGNGISNALGAVKNEIGGLIGDLGEASAVWKTFEGNMANMGKGPAEIASVKKQLQDYATETIYSASDMSSTYSQLAAVGTKNTTELVKGFGGLAAAAPEPAQAMKTLSQQATQMAALPTVQWADFKLMLQQTPAGIAAVAKTMGKTTSQLVQNIQDGKVKTQDFFNAITKTGTSGAFTKMATEYKTVGQAMDGLREGVTNKLQGAFDRVSKVGINVISSLSDKIASINFDQIADNVFKAFGTAKKWVTDFWSALVDTGAVKAFSDAWGDVSVGLDFVKAAFNQIPDGKKLNPIQMAAEGVGKAMKIAAGAISAFGKWLQSLTPEQLVMIKDLAGKAVKAFIAWKVAKKTVLPVVGIVAKLASKLSSLGKAGKGAEDAATKVGSLKQALAGGLNFGIKMAGIALVVASLALLAKSMQGIANAGPNAVANMATFGGVVGGLAVVLGLMGKKLQTSAGGIATFAASVGGMALAMTPLANSGTKGVVAMITFGAVVGGLAVVLGLMGSKLQTSMAGIAVFGATVSVMALAMAPLAATGTQGAIAMATFGVVIAGLVIIFSVFGSALTAAIPAMLVFGVTMLMLGAAALLVGAGMFLAGAGIALIAVSLPLVAQFGLSAALGFLALAGSLMLLMPAALIASVGLIMLFAASIVAFAGLVMLVAGGLLAMTGLMMVMVGGMMAMVGLMLVFTMSILAFTGLMMVMMGGMMAMMGLMMVMMGGMMAMVGLIMVFTMAMMAFTGLMMLMVGGMMAMVGLMMVGVGAMVAMAGLMLVGVMALVAMAGIIALGAGAAVAAVGMALLGAATALVASKVRSIATNAAAAADSLETMVGAVSVVKEGLSAIGDMASKAINSLVSAFQGGTGNAMAAGQALANAIGAGIQAGSASVMMASSMLVMVAISRMRTGAAQAFSAGSMIGAGLAGGMMSQLGAVTAAADALVAQADKAVRDKADIHSPSKLFGELGKFMSLGAAQGITDNLAPVAAAGSALSTAAYTGANSGGVGVGGLGSNGPSYAPSGLGLAGNSSTTNNNQSTSRQVTVAPGAIVVNAATAQDGESIVRTIEDYLRGRADAGLSS
ncbi:tape measure protein [Schleiferilactobacillus harbinensis]|uniref:Tape measure protein n=1 Tax=Schleiferilactobacillus harbinensis TaxID=304207 RepID=A0ABU7SZJ4_9LACO